VNKFQTTVTAIAATTPTGPPTAAPTAAKVMRSGYPARLGYHHL